MASEFIGYNVLVTLREPQGGRLVGQVANVFGQRLLLQDGELWMSSHVIIIINHLIFSHFSLEWSTPASIFY